MSGSNSKGRRRPYRCEPRRRTDQAEDRYREPGAAKGSRAVVFYRRGELAVFLHVFAKSRRANLTKSELNEYLKLARFLEELTAAKLKELAATEGWRELEL
jgi:hypothetical protein